MLGLTQLQEIPHDVKIFQDMDNSHSHFPLQWRMLRTPRVRHLVRGQYYMGAYKETKNIEMNLALILLEDDSLLFFFW